MPAIEEQLIEEEKILNEVHIQEEQEKYRIHWEVN